MAIVLTPILKTTTKRTPEPGLKTQKVTFSVPGEDIGSVIKYLQENEDQSFASKQNNVIKYILSPDFLESRLSEWLKEFRDNIFFLDKENERITSALLRMNWVNKDDYFVTLYQELVLNLVSAHPFYLRPIIAMIIKIFYSEAGDDDRITEVEIRSFLRAHTLLKSIIKLVPSSPFLLCAMLADKFPYRTRSSHIFLCYTKNILEICSYLPCKATLLLECTIDKLLYIDVYCNKEIIEQYELEKEEAVFPMEQENQEIPEEKAERMAYPLAHTLDIQMNCLFAFIKSMCHSKDAVELNWESTKKLYKEMLTIFDKIILPTHGCCHVQFVMFYICSLKQELLEGFLDYLWKKVQNPSVAPVVRQIAAFYIGSLLARATYVGINTVTACFDLMCHWIHQYIDMQDTNNSHDVGVHGTFHSVCQAIFYVFAFRNQELINMKNSHKYLRSLNFERIVTCRLNPLKFCQRTIVQNFANIARHYQIAYCYPVIEKNNRSLMSNVVESTAKNLSGAMVQTFFPFDPYILKQSKHWIENLYRTYNAHREEADEAMEDEDTSPDLEMSASNNLLFSYGTSPGFKIDDLNSSPPIR